MDLNKVKLDTTRVDDGEWYEVPNDEDGLRLLLRGRRSTAYKKAHSRMLHQKRRKIGRADLLIQEMQNIDKEALAKHCLLGWENLKNGNEQLPFDTDFAYELMTNRDYERFQEVVASGVSDVDEGVGDIEEELVEN